MKIPKKVHFAGFDYKVYIVKDLDGGDSWGRTLQGKGTIHLEKDQSRDKMEQTLIHELVHIALRHTTGWEKLTSEDEERLVKAWSMNIYGILKDNNLLK